MTKVKSEVAKKIEKRKSVLKRRMSLSRDKSPTKLADEQAEVTTKATSTKTKLFNPYKEKTKE